MAIAAAYVASLIVFGILDAVWLGTMASRLYRPTLGDILLSNLRIGPAIVFYLIYPVGVIIFAIMPALKSGSLTTALIHGALFGAFAYATYDLTNYATLRNWTLQITLVDIAYGAVATGVVAVAGLLAARMASGWFAG